MTYEQQIEELYKKVPSYQIVGTRAYKPGIESMVDFDDILGHPHKKFKVIHIAGTNGKGSVSSMLAVALASKGYKVALYTSPHLLDFRERIKIIEGNTCSLISKNDVLSFLDKYDYFINSGNPSFFEITTAMAFSFFAAQKVDYAVIETGLGGRLDSTNIVSPILSIITNIGFDHCSHLGNTLPEIASEKGGIIKKDTPVIIGQHLPETLPVFEKIALENNAKLILAGDKSLPDYDLNEFDLKGEYQRDNLRTVISALSEIGINVDNELINTLKQSALISNFHGRWECIRNDENFPKVICDIGHNAHGLKQVFSQLQKVSVKYKKVYIIFAVVADKDVEEIAQLMIKPCEKINYIFSKSSTSRALAAENLAERLSPFGISGVVKPTIFEAIDYVESIANSDDLIFIGGSNFTVADALSYFKFEV